MNNKQTIILNENTIRKIVTETLLKLLQEDYYSDDMSPEYTKMNWAVMNKIIKIVDENFGLSEQNLNLKLSRNLDNGNLIITMDNSVSRSHDYNVNDVGLTYKQFTTKFKEVVSKLRRMGFNIITKPRCHKNTETYIDSKEFVGYVEVDINTSDRTYQHLVCQFEAEQRKYEAEQERIKTEKEREKARQERLANWKGYSPEVQQQIDKMLERHKNIMNGMNKKPDLASKRSDKRWRIDNHYWDDDFDPYFDQDRNYDNAAKEFINSPNAMEKFKKQYEENPEMMIRKYGF